MGADSNRVRIDARHTLRLAAEDEEPFTRSAAMEALAATLGVEAGGLFMEALADPEPNVRFAAAVAIGDLKYAPAEGKLLKLAGFKTPGAERDPRVYCGIIYALHRLGNTVGMTDLPKLLFHREKEVRSNAAMVMGKMDYHFSAIRLLRRRQEDERELVVKLQVMESLAALGDDVSIANLESYAQWPSLLEKVIALQAMGRFRSRNSVQVLSATLSSDPAPRARVAAAGSLAMLGESYGADGYNLCIAAAKDPKRVMRNAFGLSHMPLQVDIDSLQEMAVVSLGRMGRTSAVDILQPRLNSQNGRIRVAAAMSILRLVGPTAPPPPPEAEKVSAPPETRPATTRPGAPAEDKTARKPQTQPGAASVQPAAPQDAKPTEQPKTPPAPAKPQKPAGKEAPKAPQTQPAAPDKEKPAEKTPDLQPPEPSGDRPKLYTPGWKE